MVKEIGPEKASRHGLLPVMGLVLALCFAGIAYFSAPPLIAFIQEQTGKAAFNQRIGGEENLQMLEIAFSIIIWFILLSVSMMIVAILVGEDPDEEDRILQPRLGDKKKTKKYFKDMDKMEKRRAKQLKAKERKEKER